MAAVEYKPPELIYNELHKRDDTFDTSVRRQNIPRPRLPTRSPFVPTPIQPTRSTKVEGTKYSAYGDLYDPPRPTKQPNYARTPPEYKPVEYQRNVKQENVRRHDKNNFEVLSPPSLRFEKDYENLVQEFGPVRPINQENDVVTNSYNNHNLDEEVLHAMVRNELDIGEVREDPDLVELYDVVTEDVPQDAEFLPETKPSAYP